MLLKGRQDRFLATFIRLSTIKNMNDTLKHLALAVLLVVLVVVSGPLIPKNQQADLLEAGAVEQVPTDPHLSLSFPEQSDRLQSSSQSELLFFTLNSEGPYALRYLTLFVEAEGVNLPAKAGDWKVYVVEEGRVNYREEVGYGESFKNELLRLRMTSDPAKGYEGEGESEFALVSPLYKTSDEAELRFNFPKFLPEDMEWEFVAGQPAQAWLDLNEEDLYHAERVEGLPSALIVLR